MSSSMTKTMLLSKEEEYKLVEDAQSNNKKALKTLVEKNSGLVHKVVHRFPLKNAQCTYEDLYQVGMMGFIHGVELFDVSRGLRLSTYVYRWIHAFVRRYYQNHGRVVRIPAHLADKKFQMDAKIQKLTQELGRKPSQEEIEEITGRQEPGSFFTPFPVPCSYDTPNL